MITVMIQSALHICSVTTKYHIISMLVIHKNNSDFMVNTYVLQTKVCFECGVERGVYENNLNMNGTHISIDLYDQNQ